MKIINKIYDFINYFLTILIFDRLIFIKSKIWWIFYHQLIRNLRFLINYFINLGVWYSIWWLNLNLKFKISDFKFKFNHQIMNFMHILSSNRRFDDILWWNHQFHAISWWNHDFIMKYHKIMVFYEIWWIFSQNLWFWLNFLKNSVKSLFLTKNS